MKTSVPKVPALLCMFFLLNISVNAKTHFPKPLELPNAEYNGCFVQFTDGTVKQFATLKLVTGIFKTPHLLADDSISIFADQVKAYQNENGFAVSQKEIGDKTKTLVAKDVLPGFALRIVKGHLNIFSIKFYNGQNATEKLFVQHGTEGQITVCTHELLEELVKENTDAVAVLHTKNKQMNITKKIVAAAEVYNSYKLLSKN